MILKEIMEQKKIAILGNTIEESKYAYIIKHELLKYGYSVYCVGKELDSLNDIKEEIDVIDLCIHPAKGIELLKESNKKAKCVVIQPGAGSEEIFKYLENNQIPYIEDCLLEGLRRYVK
ncbi:MAG: CoA-binding protein [Hespellia sp.]|nr:CoA-binding protein [Hespellia sp.]